MKLFLIILFFLQVSKTFAQPGEYGSDLIFTFRKVEIKNNSMVMWYGQDTKDTILVKPNKKGEYIVESFKTPSGGWLRGYMAIIHKKDTMIIYPPFSESENIILNIPFKKGEFLIPDIVYHTQKLFEPRYRTKLAVNLEGDWSEFEIGKEKPIKTVILKRRELFESSEKMTFFLPSFCADDNMLSQKAYPLKYYFIDERQYEKIIGNRIYIPRRIKYYFFGIVKGTNQYFLQREKDSLIEYGTLEIPIERYMQEKRSNCYRGLLYPNLEEDIYFSLYSLIDGDIPVVMGYYHGVKKCDESFGSVKIMWGIFDVYIDEPDADTIELIKKEHTIDNNLINKE